MFLLFVMMGIIAIAVMRGSHRFSVKMFAATFVIMVIVFIPHTIRYIHIAL